MTRNMKFLNVKKNDFNKMESLRIYIKKCVIFVLYPWVVTKSRRRRNIPFPPAVISR